MNRDLYVHQQKRVIILYEKAVLKPPTDSIEVLILLFKIFELTNESKKL